MSTCSQIVDTLPQTRKQSPKKSLMVMGSQIITPKSEHQFSEDGSQSMDEQELLRLQIKQLQRENNFLKKKIVEMTAQFDGDNKKGKRPSRISGKGVTKEDVDPTHLTIQYFYKEVNSLVLSLADLFKVQLNQDELVEQEAKISSETFPLKKYHIFKKATLTKSLQKIALEQDDKRYPMLIDVFSNFYKTKQQCDKQIRQTVDHLTSKVLNLNKIIYQNASKRRNSMKSSCIKSTYTRDDTNDHKAQHLSPSFCDFQTWQIPKSTAQAPVSNVRSRVDSEF